MGSLDVGAAIADTATMAHRRLVACDLRTDPAERSGFRMAVKVLVLPMSLDTTEMLHVDRGRRLL